MKKVIAVILAVVIIYLVVQIYLIVKERNQIKERLANMGGSLESLAKENNKIQSEIDYFSRWENLEKELRAQFNYKKPGEKMMIITP